MQKLQKFIYAIILIFFGIFLHNIQFGYAQKISKKSNILVDASSNNFPPMNVLNKDGHLTGFGSELADAVIKEIGGEIKHIHSSQWVEVLNWLETGKADFIHDTGYTEERDKFLDYSDPIIEMPEVIFVRPDEYSINDFYSLKGKTVACVNKHITHLYLKQFPEISLFIVKTPVEGIYELISGKVDAFVYPKQITLYLVQNLRLRDKIKITGTPLRTLSWSMVVKEGNVELLNRLNEGIAKVRKSGQYDTIYKKWWGEKVLSGYTKEQLIILTIMTTAISLAVMLSITLFLFSRKLKEKVEERTVSLYREIGERKKIEEKLEKEKDFANVVFENIEDGIVACDKNGVLTLFNRATRKFHCLPEKALPPEEWAQHYDLYHADGSTPMKKEDVPLFRALQGEHVKSVDMVIAPKQGEKRILLASGQPLQDDKQNLLGAVVSMHDVTERKKAEGALQKAHDELEIKIKDRTHELRQSYDKLLKEIAERKQAEKTVLKEKRFIESILKAAPAFFVAINPEGKILMINESMLTATGYTESEVQGQDYMTTFVPERGQSKLSVIFDKLVDQKYTINENHVLTKDGRELLIEWHGAPVFNENGEFDYFFGFGVDISERTHLAEEKKKIERQLQQAQKMEAIGTLAGGIAHDFNNILSPIMGYAELLQDRIPDDSRQKEMLKNILNGANRAKDLVQQILTFSRQTEKELRPIKAHVAVNEAFKLIKSSLPSSIEIKQSIYKECGAVLADPTQLHQIAMNLITNSYHAMEDTGGTIEVGLSEIELSDADLNYPNMNPGKYVCLSVSDTGKGIEPKNIERIFDLYFTTKDKHKGTGLGLSIVHSIIRNYKGDIRVYSELGKGTVFKVFLPVIDSDTKMDVSIKPIEELKGNEKILIVDDEYEIIKMEKIMLERLGYNVTAKTSSLDAFDVFKEDPFYFDVVITDMTMPKMTGDILAQKLRTVNPDIPIIVCTGFSEKMNEERAREIGLNGFVMKPIIRRDIAKTIRQALGDSVE